MKRLTWENSSQTTTASAALPSASLKKAVAGTATPDRLPHLKVAAVWLAAWVVCSLMAWLWLRTGGQIGLFFRAGISMTLILWAGPRHLPLVLLAWYFTTPLVSQFPPTGPYLTAVRVVAGMGPFLIGALALRQLRFDPRMRRQRDTLLFLIVGVLLPGIVSAVALRMTGFGAMDRTIPASVSILSMTPFLLVNVIPYLEHRWGLVGGRSWLAARETIRDLHGPIVILGSAAATGVTIWMAHEVGNSAGVSLYFLCFLPVAWVAVRYGLFMTTWVIFAAAFVVASLQVFAWPEAALNDGRIATLFCSGAGLVLATIEEERRQHADVVQRLASVADKSGLEFFREVAWNLGATLEADCASVCELTSPGRVRPLALWLDGKDAPLVNYDLRGTPCEKVVEGSAFVFPCDLQRLFPEDIVLIELGMHSYVGKPLRSSTGQVLGLLAVMYRRPLDETDWIEAGLAAFASRTAAEMERLRNEADLRYSEQRHKAFVQNSQESIFRVEFDPPVRLDVPEAQILEAARESGVLADINEFGVRLRGLKDTEYWVGMPLSELLDKEQAAIELVRTLMRNSFRLSKAVFPVRSEGGETRHVRRSMQGVIENGKLVRVWGTAQDVTELVEAEEEIRRLNANLEDQVSRRTLELRAAVKELEAFTYSASHDLRAPLLGILGSTRVLAEDYANVLDDEGREWLERVRQDAAYMDRLIDALLGLSRVSRADVLWGEVNLSEAANKMFDNLRRQEPQRKVEACVEAGLKVIGDPDLLRVVMENLIGNAWKFTRGRDDARIEVGSLPHAGGRAFFVRDNGAGFDPRYQSRLFIAFQRLHGNEFEGTGIGLATVQRVIHRHGGEVWAEGAPNSGATFYFTIGRPEDRDGQP